MRVLALDQALKTTGCAIFDNKKLTEHFTFELPAHKEMGCRLSLFYQKMDELYKEYKFDVLVFEDIQLQRNVITFKHLAYVQAVLILWCFYNKVKFAHYSPSQWRAILGGKFGKKREEQKEKAIQKVKEKYGIEVSSDEADAICIGAAYCAEQHEVGFGQQT